MYMYLYVSLQQIFRVIFINCNIFSNNFGVQTFDKCLTDVFNFTEQTLNFFVI